nr:ATP-binding protein [Sinorhizobium meliloti]
MPGYEREKAWAHLVANDVALWQDQLESSEAGSGALVYGPPGAGKPQIGQAFANALGLKFVSTTVGKWQKAGHLDHTLRAMHQSFAEAAAADGAVLFIDEFDSLGHRGMLHGERYQLYWQIVINEFLSLMTRLPDGVIVIGATNYRELIDPAVLRSGRIGEHFELSLPDNQTRAGSYHLKGVIDAASLADSVANREGMSGSDLEKAARNARLGGHHAPKDAQLGSRTWLQFCRRGEVFARGAISLGSSRERSRSGGLAVGFAKDATIIVRETF